MVMPCTVDASVFLSAENCREPAYEHSRSFVARLLAQAIPVIAPTLLLPEVAGGIARGTGDAGLAHQVVAALRSLPHLVLVPLDSTLARVAVEVASQHRLRGSDAVYAAVALRFGTVLVTLDREQHDRVAGVVATRYPDEAARDLEST